MMTKILSTFLFLFTSAFAQTVEWQSIGAGGGGRIPTIAISREGVTLVGCDIGGIFRSTDYGESWQNVNGTLRDYTIEMIVFDNANPRIAYAATDGGIYKSFDAGETWQLKHNGFPPQQQYSYSMPISCIGINPINHQILYAGTGRGRINDESSGKGIIYKSLNSGESWFRVNKANSLPDDALIYSLVVARSNHAFVFASTNRGVFKSTDEGVNWQNISGNLPNLQTRYLAVHHSNSNNIYVTLMSPPGVEPWQGGVWKTTDGGITWQQSVNGLYVHVGGTNEPFEVTSNYRMLIMDEQNPETLYTGNLGWWFPTLYRSTDGGGTWQGLLDGTTVDKGWLPWGISVESIAVHPINPNIIFFGTSGYALRTLDGGTNWHQVYTDKIGDTWRGRGIEITLCNRVVFDEQHPDTFYIGSYDIAGLRTTDGGNTFTPLLQNGDGGFGTIWDFAIDPVRSNVIFTAAGEAFGSQGSVMKSTDWGATWTNLNKQNTGLPNAPATAVVIDKQSPASNRIVYASIVGYGIYKSQDDGATWQKTNLEATPGFRVTKLIFSPRHGNRLYATIYRGSNTNKNLGVAWTDDGGMNWESASFYTVEDITVDPVTGDIYIARRESWDDLNQQFFEGGIFKSNDGGKTWNKIFHDIFPSSVCYSPDGRFLFAATNDHPFHDSSSGRGVWMSTDKGQTWSEQNLGLSFRAVNKMTSHPTNPLLVFAGTQGNGVFKGVISTATSSVFSNQVNNFDDRLEQNYPNPFNAGTSIGFSFGKDSEVTLTAFDILGKQVIQPIHKMLPAGRHRIILDLKNLPSGTYYYQLKAGSFSETKAMTLVK
jgi:photosystem II stability/assembly factor-like uncharacterized protein